MRLMARAQWHRGRQRGALHSWTHELTAAERLGARPETVRICSEAATRLQGINGALVAGLDATALAARAAAVQTEMTRLSGHAVASRHRA
jgi:hypothetical protein